MRNTRRLLAVCALLAAIAVVAAPQALAGSVPLKGSDSGSFTLTPDACGAGVFAVEVTDVGTATHLGKYTYHSQECFDGNTGLFTGSFTMTAANGDTIGGSYSGAVVAVNGSVANYEQNNLITGGTGRFAGAVGAFHLSGIADLATLQSSQRISGVMSSPGAGKK